MIHRRVALCASLILLLAGTTGRADLIFEANLTQDQEPPPTSTTPPTTSTGVARPQAFGTATFVLNDAETQLTMTATIFNIDVTGAQTPGDTNDNLTAAHIHVFPFPAPSPLPPTAPVRWGFFGLPDNDVNPKQLVITEFVGGVGGMFSSIWDLPEGNAGTTLTTNLPAIKAGLSYLNFHT